MRKWVMAFFMGVVVLGFGYAAHAIQELGGPAPVVPGADSQKLYIYITKPASYSDKWKLCPGTDRIQASEEPHGAFMTIYLNDIALGSLRSPKGMADGSIIVTENYAADKKLDSRAVM